MKCPKCGGVVEVLTGSYQESAGVYCIEDSCGWFGDRDPYPTHQAVTAWWSEYDRRVSALLLEMPDYPGG